MIIDRNILAGGNIYTSDEIELLINNLGGMLQVLIVRLETEHLDQAIIQLIYEILTKVSNIIGCRQATLFILNGLLNTMKVEQVIELADTALSIIESTINEAQFD